MDSHLIGQDMDVTRVFHPERDLLDDIPESANLVSEMSAELAAKYENIIARDRVSWNQEYDLVRKLGTGGQGTVFLARRMGAFDVSFQLALKFFRPDGYQDLNIYRSEMARLAEVAMDVSRIQQDHVIDIFNIVEYEGILVLATEWVDGFDLRQLLAPGLLASLQKRVEPDRWEYINDVIITNAGFQCRLMPGVVVSILRECLAGLSALHRENVIHADLKPANVMIKQTGNCKIIDLGSSFSMDRRPQRPTWTLRYAPVEVLQGEPHTPLSDLASLGYVVLELLTGTIPFVGVNDVNELIRCKHDMWKRIPELLPKDVARNGTLVEMLSKMIAPDPADRFSSLEEADLSQIGASEIARQLVKVDMDTVVSNEMRVLLREVSEISSTPDSQ
ncbi:serine/threonine-protein kinase [Thalassoglobus sp. JC818]|uniref:serine/threonine protein kinase n=1 Tax=Thalassoglobus sp. JC818 TaxID=3232136 RepID=UPI003458BDE0